MDSFVRATKRKDERSVKLHSTRTTRAPTTSGPEKSFDVSSRLNLRAGRLWPGAETIVQTSKLNRDDDDDDDIVVVIIACPSFHVHHSIHPSSLSAVKPASGRLSGPSHRWRPGSIERCLSPLDWPGQPPVYA